MVEREFPSSAEMMADEGDAEESRRTFLKIMGASTALAGFGLASCRRPETEIVPHVHQPEWQVPGKALYYATAMPRAYGATPLVAATFEGRPTKLEPNQLHPSANGTNSFTQASILNLYDPARSKQFLAVGKDTSRTAFQAALDALKGKKVAFVFGDDASPTRSLLVKEAGASAYRYEPLSPEGRFESDGEGIVSAIDFTDAKRILSLDCDFVELDQRGNTTPFYANRQPEKADYSLAKNDEAIKKRASHDLNRLYIAESIFSLTGGLADHRKRLAPSQMESFILKLTKVLKGGTLAESDADKDWLEECAKDLLANKGHSVILLGGRYEAKLHNAVNALNAILGANQSIVKAYMSDERAATKPLIANLEECFGHDAVVWMSPGNPVYDNSGIAKAIAASKTTFIHWGERTDHTALAADFHIPAANYLESWSDARTSSGIYTLIQPMIKPLYGGVTELELLIAIAKGETLFNSIDESSETPAYAVVEKTTGLNAEDWMQARREGFFGGEYETGSLKGGAAELTASAAPTKEKIDVIFAADHSVYDGRYINNAWLQEAPDPITKMTWDNAAWMSPSTATALGIFEEDEEAGELAVRVKPNVVTDLLGVAGSQNGGVGPEGEAHFRSGRLVDIEIPGGGTLRIPVIIAFGMAENTVVLPVGYGQGYDEYWVDEFSIPGAMFASDYSEFMPSWYTDIKAQWRKLSGRTTSLVGINRGFDVYQSRNNNEYFVAGAKVTTTAGRYRIAMTQEHQAMNGRALAREVSTMTNDAKHPKFETNEETEKVEMVGLTEGHDSFTTQLDKVGKQGAVDSHAPQNQSGYFAEGSTTWHDEIKAGNLISDKKHQWAMAIDLNVCNGCSACLVACQAENNIPVVGKKQVAMGREMHWIRMDRYFAVHDADTVNKYYENKLDKALGKEESHKIDKKAQLDWDKLGDSLEMIPQPVACQQCEAAPCETVCPVNATIHTEEGINAMAYNRCIGTRYCANNCPYKARRFNFFDYNKRNPLIKKNLYKGPLGETKIGEAPHLQRNPNVSVRMRGVMEKCNYCYQRLKTAIVDQKQIVKKKAQRLGKNSDEITLAAGELRAKRGSFSVACETACAASAITFGNLLDPQDPIRKIKSRNNELWEPDFLKDDHGKYLLDKEGNRVSDHKENNKLIGRSYNLLNYVATRPRTSYLARVKNPNPAMPQAANIGRNTISMGH